MNVNPMGELGYDGLKNLCHLSHLECYFTRGSVN